MKRRSYIRIAAAGVLLALMAVALPTLLVTLEETAAPGADDPNIFFSGMELSVADDGSIQAKVEVWVREVWYGTGAEFRVKYNTDYMEPSNFETNAVLSEITSGLVQRDDFFAHNPMLLANGENPFNLEYSIATSGGGGDIKYSAWDAAGGSIHMGLALDTQSNGTPAAATQAGANFVETITNGDDYITEPGSGPIYRSGLVARSKLTSGSTQDFYFFLPPGFGENGEGSKHVKLGTLSFRVNSNNLQEMVSSFNNWGWNTVENPDYLNDLVSSGTTPVEMIAKPYLMKFINEDNTDLWLISFYDGTKAAWCSSRVPTYTNYEDDKDNAYAAFDFKFNDSLIRAELPAPEVTVNAYQAFTDGTADDLSALLQKYSPMLELAYANGGMENVIMPWGLDYTDSGGTVHLTDTTYEVWSADDAKYITIDGNTVKYDPRGGTYRVTQIYYYEMKDEAGNTIVNEFPHAVTAIVHVMPVTVVDVTADGLQKSYTLDKSTIDSLNSIQTLRLPEFARLLTDINCGASSLVVPIPSWKPKGEGRKMSDITSMDKLTPTVESNNTYSAHWPTLAEITDDPTGAVLLGNGVYAFVMSDSFEATKEHKINSSDIRAVYPWLSVTDDYALEAVRILGTPNLGIDEDGEFHEASSYRASYARNITNLNYGVGTTTDGLSLTISVKRVNNLGTNTPMTETALVRMYLPDGTLVQSGQSNSGLTDADTWFNTSIYGESVLLSAVMTSDTGINVRAHAMTVTPGNTSASLEPPLAHRAELEKLRSYINLGGWFALSVKESNDDYWSDLIYVYVEPRENLYAEEKNYIFSGPNAGLYPHFDPLPMRLSMPRGTYLPVDYNNNIVDPMTLAAYDDVDYGVLVTYDGVTGLQPGRVYQFEVAGETNTTSGTEILPPKWSVDAADRIEYPVVGEWLERTIYGTRSPANFASSYDALNPFRGGVKHSATGAQVNKGYFSPLFIFDDASPYVEPAGIERIAITPVAGETGNVTTTNGLPDGPVKQVTFNTQTLGYTVREEYVLEITNIGTVDIHGLYIDVQRDFDGMAAEYLHSNYEIIDPPASFLPVGGTTTFTIVYVYNLLDMTEDYLNKIFVGSNATQVSEAAGVWTYLGEFDASFHVTKEPTHRVTLVVKPDIAGVEVGTAKIIVGEKNAATGEKPTGLTDDLLYYPADEPTSYEMDTASGSYMQDSGRPVFIYVEGADEYVLDTITLSSSAGSIYEYGATFNTLNRAEVDGETVYFFAMPDEDVLVTVTFIEPTRSKLRLGDLKVYAGPDSEDFGIDESDEGYEDDATAFNPDYLQTIYQKVFTDKEKEDNLTDNALAWAGSAGDKGFVNMPDCNQYLVVIPSDADFYSIEAILRKFIDENAATFGSISGITVSMDIITTRDGSASNHYTSTSGDTATPSIHRSTSPTISPARGSSHVVQITMGHSSATRSYFVEIMRKPEVLTADFGYGNSPFGMIMNAGNAAFTGTLPYYGETLTGTNAAKQAFINNGYRFVEGGIYTPQRVTDNKLYNVYNREAWAPLNRGFDPDAAQRLYEYNTAIPETVTTENPHPYAMPYITDSYNRPAVSNLDLNDFALFVETGAAFTDPRFRALKDSSMRDIADSEVTRYVEVVLLDGEEDMQADRFDGPNGVYATHEEYMAAYRAKKRTALIPLGTMDKLIDNNWCAGYVALGTPDAAYETALTKGLLVRPGVYQLVYEMADYDGETMIYTRDIIILPPRGDIDADGKVDTADVTLLERRLVNTPGYTASNYGKPYTTALTGDAAIFKFRVADVNNDRDINHIDANEVRYRVASTKAISRFYSAANYK